MGWTQASCVGWAEGPAQFTPLLANATSSKMRINSCFACNKKKKVGGKEQGACLARE